MDVSEFTFRLIVLFLPGLIAFLIVEALTIHRSIPMVRVFLYSLVLGFLCYFIHYPLAKVLAGDESSFSFMDFLKTSQLTLEPNEIFLVTSLSIPLALLISLALNKHWLHRVAYRIRVSKKFANPDVWSLVMNEDGSEWVVVRDLEHDLIYEGWVVAFSDSTDDFDEVLLTDARVYRNSTGQELYKVPSVYLSTRHGNKIVEFPSMRGSIDEKKQSE